MRWLKKAASAVAVAVTTVVVTAAAAWAQTGGNTVTLTPDAGAGPGGPQLQTLVNWGAGMAFIVCVGALVVAAIRWAWGSHSHNIAQSKEGKEGVIRAVLVAGVIAAAAALVNFATSLGGAVK